YRELDASANRLARALRARGAHADGLVGVAMERSIELVVALFAVEKAGAAYVPLDPDYPEERLAFMRRDASFSLLVTQRALADRFASPPAGEGDRPPSETVRS